MSSQSSNLSLFRKRDLIALAIILLALYVSIDMHGYNYSIEPDWYLDQRKAKHTHGGQWIVVPPIVTDLDGNGENEIIAITRDHHLKVG